ncbi:MAG: aminomethyltransferase [Solirubrobacteraceae bacterium]|jgi:glycine cleavage system aminomethyltransferase T|nr:aminomethyltransferase [Solirubrobacteraceae bacterium]
MESIAPRHSPLEPLLIGSGATMLQEFGVAFASNFGSVAGEVAACLRSVGLADRSDLVKLDVTGPAGAVAALLAAIVPRPPAPGEAVHVHRAWWSVVTPRHVFVLVDPSHAAAVLERLGRAARSRRELTWTDASDAWAVIAVIGPRAAALMRAPTLMADAPPPDPGAVVEVSLAGTDAVVIRESPQEFLVSVPPSGAEVVWRALHAAGAHLGVASVGREAHERFEIAAGIRRSRTDHSGW